MHVCIQPIGKGVTWKNRGPVHTLDCGDGQTHHGRMYHRHYPTILLVGIGSDALASRLMQRLAIV
jgi:hypothetical protein